MKDAGMMLPRDLNELRFNLLQLDRVKRIWYLSPMRAAKVQASLRIRAVSPEPSLLALTSSESRGTFRQKARSLAPLNGWACAVKVCHDGMLEDTNSLDGAQLMFPSKFILLLLQIKRCVHLSWFVCSDKILFIDWWKECSYLGFTARQDYFTHFEPSQSYGGAITGDTREKPPDHPQEELGLSHMWPEVSSNPHRWDDERVTAFFLWHLLFVTNKSTNDQYRNHCSWQVS